MKLRSNQREAHLLLVIFNANQLHIWNPEVERNSSTIDTSSDRYGKDWRGSRDRGFGG